MFGEVMQALRDVTDPPDTSRVPQPVGGSFAQMLGVGAGDGA